MSDEGSYRLDRLADSLRALGRSISGLRIAEGDSESPATDSATTGNAVQALYAPEGPSIEITLHVEMERITLHLWRRKPGGPRPELPNRSARLDADLASAFVLEGTDYETASALAVELVFRMRHLWIQAVGRPPRLV